jgi:cell division protein FtsB
MDEIKQPESTEKDTRKSGKDSIPGILLRLILTAFIGIIIGILIYYTAAGWIPYLDQRVFQPIDNNQIEIQDLQATQQSLENEIHLLQNNHISNQATLEYMEMDIDQMNENSSSLQETVELSVQFMLQHTQSIATLDAKIESANRNFSALATAQMNGRDFHQKLGLLKILDILIHANQYLLHANFGQAENQLILTKTELETLFIQTPDYQQAFIHDLLNLVEGAVEDLPNNYSIAEEKMQLAIQMALQGFPEFDPSLTLTPTPYITPSLTPTPQS